MTHSPQDPRAVIVVLSEMMKRGGVVTKREFQSIIASHNFSFNYGSWIAFDDSRVIQNLNPQNPDSPDALLTITAIGKKHLEESGADVSSLEVESEAVRSDRIANEVVLRDTGQTLDEYVMRKVRSPRA